jgi:hypothetical protein
MHDRSTLRRSARCLMIRRLIVFDQLYLMNSSVLNGFASQNGKDHEHSQVKKCMAQRLTAMEASLQSESTCCREAIAG